MSDVDDVQAIEKIFAKSFFFDFLVKIFVGRSENSHVRIDRASSAEPFELAVLQHAQQLHLNGRTDLADLIEKQRAAVGQFESAFLAGIRAGEGALLISEQFGFEKRIRQAPRN